MLLNGEAAAEIGERIFRPDESLHAPHLLDLEVAQVVRRFWLAGSLGAGRGREVLDDLLDLPIRRHAHGLLLPRIWELRHNVTAYDAAYLALAEALDARLLTRDVRLAGAPSYTADVQIV